MIKDDLGQASLDFLAGIIIFMGSLVMIIQFIPGIFTPFQTEATDLNAVAYRTGVLLLEDPGWWSRTDMNGTINASGTNWENQDWWNHLNDPNFTLRVGLASLDATNRTIPNVLNKKKLQTFANMSKDNITEFLGLYRNISGNKVKYGYNITLYYSDGSLVKINSTNITAGDPIPSAQGIAKIERLVLAHTMNLAKFDASLLNYKIGEETKTWINITGVQEEDVFFEITNFNITPPPPPTPPSLDDINVPPAEYVLWKKTNTSNFILIGSIPPGGIEINSTDTLRFEIKKSFFVPGTNNIILNFNNRVKFPQQGSAADYVKYLVLENTKLVVEVWQ